jgi:hypothetical protein
MMYLNGGFKGGATNFLYKGQVDYATIPRTGMAIVFDHRECLADSAALVCGGGLLLACSGTLRAFVAAGAECVAPERGIAQLSLASSLGLFHNPPLRRHAARGRGARLVREIHHAHGCHVPRLRRQR